MNELEVLFFINSHQFLDLFVMKNIEQYGYLRIFFHTPLFIPFYSIKLYTTYK